MASIGKNILFFRVSVQIDKHLNPILILHHIFFYGIDLLASVNVGDSPAAVQVVPCDVAPGIA